VASSGAGAGARGRWFVIAALLAGATLLAVAIVDLSTREGGPPRVDVSGENESQALFGGLPQDGARVGEGEAPVSIQIFNDVSCDDCSEWFEETVPGLVEEVVRDGEAQLLYRHYSFSARPVSTGFLAAEAAAEQDYLWQYVYLFFASQEEAERVGPQGFSDFLKALAGSIDELEPEQWERDFEEGAAPDGEYIQRVEEQDELARDLELRDEPSAIVAGPNGTEVLQDSPGLDEILEAVEQVD
jgi:protein-disulfide isomerase